MTIRAQKFRKRPIIVEATQWFRNGDHPDDHIGEQVPDPGYPANYYTRNEGAVVRYFRRPGTSGDRPCDKCHEIMHDHGWIDTLEGGHIVCPGDWIVTGAHGEFYPVKDAIFQETYEPVMGGSHD